MNRINRLSIKNFKSIRELDLSCNRINLLIGRPNVGKSNIIEALSLYSGIWSTNHEKHLSDLIRYRELSNLFYDQDVKEDIVVKSDIGFAGLQKRSGGYSLFSCSNPESYDEIAKLPHNERASAMEKVVENRDLHFFFGEYMWNDGKAQNQTHPRMGTTTIPVKRYIFQIDSAIAASAQDFLTPPTGSNLFQIVETNRNVRKIAADYFRDYDLDLLLDPSQKKLEIQKRVNDFVYKVPYHLTASTLQRMIFHVSAILSNKNSILLFEEPEAHAFPPYIRDLANHIVENRTNQFFIATHSPYLFNTLVENSAKEDIGVFAITYDNWETKAHKISDSELSEMMDFGMDVFFQSKWLS